MAIPKINHYLSAAAQRRASDVHFAADDLVRARIDGDLVALDTHILTGAQVQEIIFEILSPEERERFHEQKNIDKSYVVDSIGYFRVNVFLTRKGMSAVLRTIPKKIPTYTELGLPESVVKLAELGKGLILVTGPTGSGKSTTLASLIHYINQTFKYHILTVEDPVEFVHTSQTSLINQREIGGSVHTFADALKYALREDPDVILVGEMRDLETIALALTAAETGHLVFGTLHTRGAGASIDRIIDSFPANQQAMVRTMLSESLAGVVSQALLKRADGLGRAAAYEIMVVNHAISNLIREGKTFQIPSIMQTSRKEGMVLMDQYIVEMVEKGIVSPAEAEGYMEDPAILRAKGFNSKFKEAVNTPLSSTPRPVPPVTPKLTVARPNEPVASPSVKKSPAPAFQPKPTAAESEHLITDLTDDSESIEFESPGQKVETANPASSSAEKNSLPKNPPPPPTFPKKKVG